MERTCHEKQDKPQYPTMQTPSNRQEHHAPSHKFPTIPTTTLNTQTQGRAPHRIARPHASAGRNISLPFYYRPHDCYEISRIFNCINGLFLKYIDVEPIADFFALSRSGSVLLNPLRKQSSIVFISIPRRRSKGAV